ncbi:D-lactate dehydrogenase [Kushneria sinocarnis]|uniref:D-lactate dehydrogenase n=1 Tax=Kushneria sinocarnis TaxID=595502 RepID=A0A420X125_9GAMM|nr:2-hydroxyacid dehydrogenase [Kushneria sinocarnis]RKR07474.1 D-lactate dehydrogenase [Kushneria sinocarnis]
MRVTVFSAQSFDQRFLDAALAETPFEPVYHPVALSLQTVALAEHARAVCVFVNDVLDAPVLEALHGFGVQIVVLRCAGYNQVDLDAARRLGLAVARVPGYSPQAVAEHTLALVMTLNRHTHRAFNRVREGNFNLDGLLGVTLHGRTVGVVGTGRIGLATARIFAGMGCRVLGYDPAPAPAFEAVGELVDFDTLLARADIVSLHCPLADATHHLINAATLARMKPGAMLVNTSRGGLIDTRAVIEALRTHRLGALAIDVYEQESELFFRDHSQEIINDDMFARLAMFPNVLMTGHQGFFTEEALDEIARTTRDNLLALSQGHDCANALVRPGDRA